MNDDEADEPRHFGWCRLTFLVKIPSQRHRRMSPSKVIPTTRREVVVIAKEAASRAFSGHMHLHRSPDERSKSNEDKF
jgi:hypothetical protein